MKIGLKTFMVALLLVLGCAGPEKRVSENPEKSAFLFPYGSYIHHVKLNIPANPDPTKRVFEFRGAVKISADAIRIVVLSPIGTTIFKMSEDRRTGKVTTENFVSQLKPYEAKLAEYYASLRVLLTTLRHPEGSGVSLDPAGRPLRMKAEIAGRPTLFTFANYDDHQIPNDLRVESEQFNVDVKVVGYVL